MLSVTAQYAIRAVVALAELPEGERGCAACIAERTGIPANYLSKILKQLARSGLLLSQKGQGGGFQLARPAREISLSQVIETLEPVRQWSACLLGSGGCNPEAPCPAHRRWQSVRDTLRTFLASTTVADLAQKRPGARVV